MLTYLRPPDLFACLLPTSLTHPLTHAPTHARTYVRQELPPHLPARADRRLTATRSEPSLRVQRPACRPAENGLQTLPSTVHGAAAGSSGGAAAAARLAGMPRRQAEREALRTLPFEPRGAVLAAVPPPAGYPPVAVVRTS